MFTGKNTIWRADKTRTVILSEVFHKNLSIWTI